MNPNNKETQKDLITSEDVKASLSGNEQALIEQLERAKQVALEQLQAKKEGKTIQGGQVINKTQEQLEKELAQRELELNAAKVAAGLNINQNPQNNLNNNNIPISNFQAPQVKQNNEPKELNIDNVKLATELPKQQEIKTSPKSKKLLKKQLKEQKRLEKKKAKELKKANSNFKYIMTALLFIGLFILVHFLPEISNYISTYQANELKAKQQIITTGYLECELKKSSKKFDIEYINIFSFTDSKLIKLTYKNITKGSVSLDRDELNEMKNNCETLKEKTKNLDGIIVRCSLKNGVNTNEQVLTFENINEKKINSSYIEAGGIYPNYKYKENIDKIEKEMKASGYTCERTR